MRVYRTLGMDEGITRRDFLNATLLASGGVPLGGCTRLEGAPMDHRASIIEAERAVRQVLARIT